ncbi:MAG: heat shock protein transcriptional repressor HspR [Dehalococcoidia bacterium]
MEASPIGEEMEGQAEESELKGVYVISVAARLLNMHPQTLRKYERLGLVQPSRTEGMLRLYSEEDIARLRIIKHLVDEVGLNLAGVEMMLEMLRSLMEMHWRLHSMARGEQVWEMLEERLTQLLQPFTMRLDEP